MSAKKAKPKTKKISFPAQLASSITSDPKTNPRKNLKYNIKEANHENCCQRKDEQEPLDLFLRKAPYK